MERDDVGDPVGPSDAGARADLPSGGDGPVWGLQAEVAVLLDLLGAPGTRWLDVGCGAGLLLDRFPGVDRTVLDVAPSTADGASEQRGDQDRTGDLADDVEEWHGAFDVVSCTWPVYQHVATLSEARRAFDHLVGWIAPGGALLVPLVDLDDLRGSEVDGVVDAGWGGSATLTGTTWRWRGDDGTQEAELFAPQADHVVGLVAPAFEKVEVLRHVPNEPGGPSRKALLATGRHVPGEGAPAEVVVHPPVRHPDDVAAEAAAVEREAQEAEEKARLEAQVAEDVAGAEARRADEEGAMRRQIDRDGHELEYLRAEVHRLHRLLGEKPPPEVVVSTDVSGASTSHLARVVLGRVNPFTPGFGRRIMRRLGR